jgi:hypothetical protein
VGQCAWKRTISGLWGVDTRVGGKYERAVRRRQRVAEKYQRSRRRHPQRAVGAGKFERSEGEGRVTLEGMRVGRKKYQKAEGEP